jgi:hypothetical protein
MATINLGSIKFNWRGDYAAGTAYSVDDVVNSSGTSYVCIAATTGNAPPNATYWNVMAQGGTDVGTTLTTQGDILYRDGSGLARLGAGTSGQVLQTGGTGANPSWTTMTSDYVKLASGTVTSGSSFNINGYFSNTYQNYKIYISNVKNWMKMRFNFGASYTTYGGSNYVWVVNYGGRTSSTENNGTSGSWNVADFPLSYWSGDNTAEHTHAEITLVRPWDATNRAKNAYVNGWDYNSSEVHVYNNAAYLDANKYNEAMTGVYIFQVSSGTFADCNWQLYGIK